MADYDWIFQTLGYLVIAAPSLLFGTLGTASLVERRLSEQVIGRLARFTIATGLLAVTALLDLMLIFNTKHVVVPIANWEFIPGYHFVIKFVFDRLSVPFVILAFVLCGTVAQFA